MATSRADKPAIRTQVRAWVEKRVAVTFTGVSPFLRRHFGLSPGHRLPALWIVERGTFSLCCRPRSARRRGRAHAAAPSRRPRRAARPASRLAKASGGRSPAAVWSIVPTSVRTMWRRNESASMRNTSSSPRCSQAASSTVRRKTWCWVSAGVKARKSCSPSSARAHAVEQLVRAGRAASATCARRAAATARASAARGTRSSRERAEKRAWKPSRSLRAAPARRRPAAGAR